MLREVKLVLKSRRAEVWNPVSSPGVLCGSASIFLCMFIYPGYYASRITSMAQKSLRALACVRTSLTLQSWNTRNSLFSLGDVKVKAQLSAKEGGNTVLTSVFKTGAPYALAGLVQGSANFSCKGPDSKYSQLCRTYVLSHNYSTLLL